MRVIAIAAGALVATVAAAQTVSDDAYRIKPGDRLAISVLEDPGLNQTVLVRPDGRISLPLAGSVAAATLSPEQLEVEIRRQLSDDFIEPPNVTVALVGIGAGEPARIYALGQIGNPGQFQVELPITLLQALALAGGPGTFAATDRIQVRRRDGRQEVVFLFDYEVVEDGRIPTADFDLADGDVIIVPERGLFD